MTNEKIYFTDKAPEDDYVCDYIAELEDKLWKKELEARKAAKRAEELQNRLMKQQAYKKAAERQKMRIINCSATIVSIFVTYIWILAAAADILPAITTAIPLTVGLSAAYRWGKF